MGACNWISKFSDLPPADCTDSYVGSTGHVVETEFPAYTGESLPSHLS